jgi:hypothetical protein
MPRGPPPSLLPSGLAPCPRSTPVAQRFASGRGRPRSSHRLCPPSRLLRAEVAVYSSGTGLSRAWRPRPAHGPGHAIPLDTAWAHSARAKCPPRLGGFGCTRRWRPGGVASAAASNQQVVYDNGYTPVKTFFCRRLQNLFQCTTTDCCKGGGYGFNGGALF